MLLVTARRKGSSLSVGVATAADAVKKVNDLEGEGYVAFVFDCAGRERPIEELRAQGQAGLDILFRLKGQMQRSLDRESTKNGPEFDQTTVDSLSRRMRGPGVSGLRP